MNYRVILDKIYENINIKSTIVGPVYNQEKLIIQNINSIIFNTLGDYEIIIINDYSNDKTLELLNNFFCKLLDFKQYLIAFSGNLESCFFLENLSS